MIDDFVMNRPDGYAEERAELAEDIVSALKGQTDFIRVLDYGNVGPRGGVSATILAVYCDRPALISVYMDERCQEVFDRTVEKVVAESHRADRVAEGIEHLERAGGIAAPGITEG